MTPRLFPSPPQLARLLLAALVLAAHSAYALHFYLDAGEHRCFTEDLPTGTAINGAYKVELWSSNDAAYVDNVNAGVRLTVISTASMHSVVDQKGGHKGKFSFTASEAGDHQICLSVSTAGWFGARSKIYLDIQFADSIRVDKAAEYRKSAYADLLSRLKFLSTRIQSTRNGVKHQRDREIEFRDASEVLNSAAIRWTLVQMVILGLTCAWQLRHLRQFFITKKLV